MKPYGNYILIELINEDRTDIGKIIDIGCTVPKKGIKKGDIIQTNETGPFYEFHHPTKPIEPNEKEPEKLPHALIDYRSIICILNKSDIDL